MKLLDALRRTSRQAENRVDETPADCEDAPFLDGRVNASREEIEAFREKLRSEGRYAATSL